MEFAHVYISQPVLGATTPTMTSFKKATQGPTMSPQNLTLVNSIIEEEMWCFPFNLDLNLGERKTSERKTQLSTGQSSMFPYFCLRGPKEPFDYCSCCAWSGCFLNMQAKKMVIVLELLRIMRIKLKPTMK